MAFAIKARLDGLEGALRSLDALGRTLRNQILRKAINAGSRLILDAARQLVPRGTGLLKKSLAVRLQTYRRTGTVVAVIGPRTGYTRTRQGKKLTAYGQKMKASGQNPSKYAHLVEFGHAEIRAVKARVLSDGSTVYGTVVKSVPARPFLRPAFERARGDVIDTMSRRIAEEIEKAGKRLRSK